MNLIDYDFMLERLNLSPASTQVNQSILLPLAHKGESDRPISIAFFFSCAANSIPKVLLQHQELVAKNKNSPCFRLNCFGCFKD